MHHRKILRTLIFALAFLFITEGQAAKVDVYKEFQSKIDVLEKELVKEKDVIKRYDLFLKTYKDMAELRKKNPRQAESKELNMSLFVDTLAPLPAQKDFKSKNCSQYLKDVAGSMKSYQTDGKEPFVDRAVKITGLICK